MNDLLERHDPKLSRREVLGGFVALTFVTATSTIHTNARAAERRVIELALRKRRIEGGARVVRVTQGDEVELRWSADEPVSLHLHGYDLHASPAPDAPAKMAFNARATGRFPITAHSFAGERAHAGGHREQTLIYLEVHPR